MVLVWIGIGIGILIAIILIRKIIMASPKTAFKLDVQCRRCGYRTNGLKCPRCESTSDTKRWR